MRDGQAGRQAERNSTQRDGEKQPEREDRDREKRFASFPRLSFCFTETPDVLGTCSGCTFSVGSAAGSSNTAHL